MAHLNSWIDRYLPATEATNFRAVVLWADRHTGGDWSHDGPGRNFFFEVWDGLEGERTATWYGPAGLTPIAEPGPGEVRKVNLLHQGEGRAVKKRVLELLYLGTGLSRKTDSGFDRERGLHGNSEDSFRAMIARERGPEAVAEIPHFSWSLGYGYGTKPNPKSVVEFVTRFPLLSGAPEHFADAAS